MSTIQEIKGRGEAKARKQKESEIDRALELGVKKGMFVIGSEEDAVVRLVNPRESTQKIDELYATQMKDEVAVMSSLSHNCEDAPVCLWNFILQQFECQKNPSLQCSKCSGGGCSRGGDIAPNSQAGNIFYQVQTPSGLSVFALNKYGEDLDADEDRLKEIFMMHRPSMVVGQSCACTAAILKQIE